MTASQQFCRILRVRSAEHKAAAQLLFTQRLYGQIISILRQELDSMVRAIFLASLNSHQRQHYVNQTLNNEKWTLQGTNKQITDRQMVDFANTLHGWTRSVYKLGCAFIHLSALADYQHYNPFLQLPIKEQQDIKQYLHDYHGFPLSNTLSVGSVAPYLVMVLEKISNNLEYEIQRL